MLDRLTLSSPLDVVLSLPWAWFGAGGGAVVFLKGIEYWLNSPGRIRAQRARYRAEQAVHEATEAQARERELRAYQNIELLASGVPSALRSGELDTPEPFDWPFSERQR